MFDEYTVVIAVKALSPKVNRGCIGIIVMVYDNPTLAYEVEFFDNRGNTIELLTVKPNEIEAKTM